MPDNIDFILGRLEGKLDALLSAHNETRERVNKQDERIDAIERRIAYVSGAFAVVGFAANFVIGKVL